MSTIVIPGFMAIPYSWEKEGGTGQAGGGGEGCFRPQAWGATKDSGLMGLNLYSIAILIVDLSFDIDLEFWITQNN